MIEKIKIGKVKSPSSFYFVPLEESLKIHEDLELMQKSYNQFSPRRIMNDKLKPGQFVAVKLGMWPMSSLHTFGISGL